MNKLNTNKNSIREKFIISITILCVFIGIYNALNSWLNLHYKEWRNELTLSRISETEKLVANSDCQYYITSKILPLLKYISEKEDIDLDSIQKHYLNKYDLDFSIFLFNNESILKQVAPHNASNIWLMKNVFPYLIEKDLKKLEHGSKQLDKKIEFTFGYGKNLVSISDSPETVINSVSAGRECFFTWTKRNNKGILIYGNKFPDSNKLLELASQKKPEDKDYIFGGKISDTPQTEQELTAKAADLYFSKKSQEKGIYNNREWYFSTNKKGEKYYTSYKIGSSIYSRGLIYLKVLFVFIIPLLFLLIINIRGNLNLSLKQLVLLIFLASAMIPIGLICSESFESIETYSDIYENELKSSMEEVLGNCIQNLDNYINTCSNKLKALTEPQNSVYDFKEMEKNISKEFYNSKFSTRDAACEIIYSNYPQYSPGQDTLYKALGRMAIKKNRADRADELPYKTNLFAEEMVSRDDLGLNVIPNRPNRLQFVYNTGIKMLLFLKLFPKEAGREAIMYIILDIQNTIKEYIKKIDKRSLIANQQQINLLAFYPMGYKWILPPSFNHNIFLDQAKAAFITGKPIFRKLKYKDNSYYSLAVSNSTIDDICYLGFVSSEKLEREILTRKTIITLCAILSLILFFTLTIWIMRQLINPLSDLEKGIFALEKRKYEIQIPVPQGKDEFVQLFKEFNFMMNENYDMQMAKNVQEGLITTVFPNTKDYLISGKSFPIDKLSGDCLTSFVLPDDKILFLVGDISGLGIGSALIMASIRSIAFHWCQSPQNDPLSLVSAIDQMFRSNKNNNMFMGLICGILNTNDKSIKLVTRGHIFPLFLRNNNSYEWLGQASLPLGIGKNHETKLIETKLLPNERMLCITNGFIKLKNNNSTDINYEKIEKWASQAISEDNSNWVDNIKALFDQWCVENDAKPIDDIILFSIISKETEGNTKA